MKSRHNKTKKSYDLNCPQCGMSITVKCKNKRPGSDIIFVCCGESMKVNR